MHQVVLDYDFYVTARDESHHYFILGPYSSLQIASDNIDRARRLLCSRDPWSHFAAMGTASVPAGGKIKTAYGR